MTRTREALASRTLTGYLWGSRDRLWRGLGLALLRSLAVAPCPWLFQRMIDVAVPARDSIAILKLGGLFFLLLAVHYVFSVWGANEIAKAMAQMMVELRSGLFFKLRHARIQPFHFRQHRSSVKHRPHHFILRLNKPRNPSTTML